MYIDICCNRNISDWFCSLYIYWSNNVKNIVFSVKHWENVYRYLLRFVATETFLILYIYIRLQHCCQSKASQFTSLWTSRNIKGKPQKNDFLALLLRFPEVNLMAFPSMPWKFARNIAFMSRQINNIPDMSARHVLLNSVC